jgi:hypothetical protein
MSARHRRHQLGPGQSRELGEALQRGGGDRGGGGGAARWSRWRRRWSWTGCSRQAAAATSTRRHDVAHQELALEPHVVTRAAAIAAGGGDLSATLVAAEVVGHEERAVVAVGSSWTSPATSARDSWRPARQPETFLVPPQNLRPSVEAPQHSQRVRHR